MTLQITEVHIFWDDQDSMNIGWCARSYNGNETLEDCSLGDIGRDATDRTLIAELPNSWQRIKDIRIFRG